MGRSRALAITLEDFEILPKVGPVIATATPRALLVHSCYSVEALRFTSILMAPITSLLMSPLETVWQSLKYAAPAAFSDA